MIRTAIFCPMLNAQMLGLCESGVCAVGELAAAGVAGGAVLRRSGWLDAGLIHSSAESLH